jgi:hypothetical protein
MRAGFPGAALRPLLPGHLLFLGLAALVFWRALFLGEALYFRDLSSYYHPNRVFVARALDVGVWPLWNPACDAGAPFLMGYPVELATIAVLGPARTLVADPLLHLWIAMAGAAFLARTLGLSRGGATLAGAAYGLSGLVLSSTNLVELLHGLAWAPVVVACLLRCWERPTLPRVALAGPAVSLHVSTLAAETVIAAGLATLVLMRAPPSRRRVAALLSAGGLALLLAAPVLAGVRALVEGTRRAGGLSAAEAFGYSLHPLALLDAVLPRFFGDVHAASDLGFWGQAFFPDGFPYFQTLYVGLATLVLAACAGRSAWRPWVLVGLGVLLALGSHGPLGSLLSPLMRVFRTPPKLLVLAALGLALLAGAGFERVRRGEVRVPAWVSAPGVLLVVLALALGVAPRGVAAALAPWLPDLASPRAEPVLARQWPVDFLVAGALAAAAGLGLRAGRRWAVAVAAVALLDLWSVNRVANPTAWPSFYTLRPEVQALVDHARARGDGRIFAYGLAGSPGAPLDGRVVDGDAWLYYLDRQTLLPRTHVLDGLDAAFDEDRVGWAPEGSTLSAGERQPPAFASVHERLRLAGVRWVLSLQEIPSGLVALRGTAPLPGLLEPLRLYELAGWLPRARWVPRAGEAAPATAPSVRLERLDPHTVRVHADTPPGTLVVAEGTHPAWQASEAGRPVPLGRADGRYWAIATEGGRRTIDVRFDPGWRSPSLALAALGLVAAVPLLLAPWLRPSR